MTVKPFRFFLPILGLIALFGCTPASELLSSIKLFVDPPSRQIVLQIRGLNIQPDAQISIGNAVPGGTVDCEVTIRNTSSSDSLQLTGSPLVEITGAEAGYFSVQSDPSTTIGPDSNTTFTLRASPDDLQRRTATITVRSSDSVAGVYSIDVVSAGALATGDAGLTIAMAASGSDFQVLFADESLSPQALRCARSTDGGVTFPNTVDVQTYALSAPYQCTVATDGSNLHAAYYTNGRTEYKRSIDDGATWADVEAIAGSSDPRVNGISVSGSNVLVAYYTWGAGTYDLWSRRSTDGGLNWDAAVSVESDGDVGAYCASAIDGTTAYIAYYDVTNNSLKCARSTDAGANWGTIVTVASGVAPGGLGSVCRPISIVTSGGTTYIAFYDWSNDQLYVAKSTDGTTWPSGDVHLVDQGGYAAALVLSGSTLYLAYRGADYPRLARSTDGAATWTTAVIDSTVIPGSEGIGLGVSGSTVCVAYRVFYNDGGVYTWDVLLARSTDGGVTW